MEAFYALRGWTWIDLLTLFDCLRCCLSSLKLGTAGLAVDPFVDSRS